MVALPTATIDTSATNFIQPVATSSIDAADNLVGFQGDFTFDSTVVTFQNPPVSNAGLTAGNWSVSGNILPGPGPIRTLHLSALSNDSTPLSGAGTLFNLKMTRLSGTHGASTALTWAVSQDNFVYIDANSNVHPPVNTPPGSITIQGFTAIAGTVSYCSDPSSGPVSGVTLDLTGNATASTLSDGSGNYQFSSLLSGGSYTVTPNKSALLPGATGISTIDIVAAQRHFLNVTPIPASCRLTAADVNNDSNVNTIDVVAIQRFFLGVSTGTANVGKYLFSPVSRTYPAVANDHTGENYDVLIFGDVASPFADREIGPAPDITDEETSAAQAPPAVQAIILPITAFNRSVTNLNIPVTTTLIDPKDKLVGFQGDLTFDERVMTFQNEPAQKAGLTGGNWNVSGNVLEGRGPIRTLRISAFSNELEPLSGSGTLFELKVVPASNGARITPLTWAAPPNQFIFIDTDLNTRRPGSSAQGSIGR